jgi:hypothetical protein
MPRRGGRAINPIPVGYRAGGVALWYGKPPRDVRVRPFVTSIEDVTTGTVYVNASVTPGVPRWTPVTGPTIRFADDFETGDLRKWNTDALSPGMAVSATDPLAGVYSFRLTPDPDGGGWIKKTFGTAPSTTGVTSVRWRVRRDADPVGDTNHGIIIWSNDGDAANFAQCVLSWDSGSGWRIQATLYSPVTHTGTSGGEVVLPDGVLTIELVHDTSGAHPILTAYVGGIALVSATDISGEAAGADWFPANLFVNHAWNGGVLTMDNVSVADGVQGV